MKRQADDAGGGGDQGSSSAAAASDPSPSLFDPTHLPTLLPRILSLASLVAQASSSSDSLFMRTEAPGTAPDTGAAAGAPSQNEQQPQSSAPAPAPAPLRPDITLGASSEEDVDVALQLIREHQAAAGASGGNYAPTKLHGNLVREAKELDDAFRRARESVDGLMGKDLDVAEQEDLIEILENYRQRQETVRENFTQRADTLLAQQDEKMDVS